MCGLPKRHPTRCWANWCDFITSDYRIPNWNFPSVYGVVAGVAYGSDEPLDVQYRPIREYRLDATGTSEIGSFSAAVMAPDELGGLSVAGSEVGVEARMVPDVREVLGGRPLAVVEPLARHESDGWHTLALRCHATEDQHGSHGGGGNRRPRVTRLG